MRNIRLSWSRVVALLLASLVSLELFAASNFVPASPGIKVLSGDQRTANDILIASPNSNGISVNLFEAFSVNDKPVRLVNLGTSSSRPAKLIVLVSESFDIRNKVEVIGPATDLLILAGPKPSTGSLYQYISSDSRIECVQCEFINTTRLSLVTGIRRTAYESAAINPSEADIWFDQNASEVKYLWAGYNMSISIDGMEVPGAIGVDLFASDVTVTGDIDLNDRVDSDSAGGYVKNPAGSMSVGSGQLNIYVGSGFYDYDSRKIVTLFGSALGNAVRLNADLYAPGLAIHTSMPAILNGKLDTRTDLLTTIRYKDQTLITPEGIEINSYGPYDLELNSAALITDTFIKARSASKMSVGNNTLPAGVNEIELIAKNDLTIYQDISAATIDIAAGRLINESSLTATEHLEAWADGDLFNQYGGIISAPFVNLQSDKGIIRNGSRTPYRDLDDQDSLFDFSEGFLDNLDFSLLGSFYNSDVDTSGVGYVMAPKTRAHIQGYRVQISASGFENINPYYVKADQDGNFPFDPLLASQVSVSAEDRLDIRALNYVLNSSARIQTNAETARLNIEGGNIINERYRIATGLEYQEIYDVAHDYGATIGLLDLSPCLDTVVGVGESFHDQMDCVHEKDTRVLSTQTHSYSPPGIILAKGNTSAKAPNGILNNVSYIEVFGDLTLDTPLLHDIGLENSSAQNAREHVVFEDGHDCASFLYTYIDNFERKFSSMPISSAQFSKYLADCRQIGANGDFGFYFADSFFDENPNELDSLFYVAGDQTSLDDSFSYFRNGKPLDHFVEMAIDNLVGDVAGFSQTEADSLKGDLDTIYETGVIEAEGRQFSLFEQLMRIFEEITEMISNLFTEFDWWGSEE